MIRFLLALAGVLLVLTNRSEGSPPNKEHNGLWSQGECASSKSYVYRAPRLYLSIEREGLEWTSHLVAPIGSRETEFGLIEEWSFGDGKYSITYTSVGTDRLLITNTTTSYTAFQALETLPASPPAGSATVELTKCTNLPPDVFAVFAESVRFMELATRIYETCVETQNKCADQVFAYADVSNDQKLSVAEVSRMIRILVSAAVSSNPDGVTEKALTASLATAVLVGPLLATSIVSSADYNADGQLSLNEILYDRNPEISQKTLETMSLTTIGSTVSAILKGLGNLPGLP